MNISRLLFAVVWLVMGTVLNAPLHGQKTGSSLALESFPMNPVARPASEGKMPGIAEMAPDVLQRSLPPPTASVETAGWSLFNHSSKKRSTVKTAATAALVLSLSLLALFLLRMKHGGRRRGGLPDDVVAVLGQTAFGPNQKLQLVRLGSKLLLVTTTPAGSHTLGEITDAEEVLQIESICLEGRFDAIGQGLRNRARQAAIQSAASTGRSSSGLAGGRTLLEA